MLEYKTFHQALVIPDWKKAIQAKYNALMHNNTWELVPMEDDMKVIEIIE